MQDGDVEKVIMNIRNAMRMMDPIFMAASSGTMLLITYLFRMLQEKKLKPGQIKDVQEFMKVTKGNFFICNVPMGKEAELQKELEALGVRFTIMPDLNKEDGLLQVGVYNDDKDKFSAWYERHLMNQMSGGVKDVQDLNNLTAGKTSIISIPCEGKETLVTEDFKNLNINYAILPDLNVGDGEIQFLIANIDVEKVKHWYSLYRDDQLKQGQDLGDMKVITMEGYKQMGQLSEEEYIHTASPDLQKANEKYEGRAPGEIEYQVSKVEGKMKSFSDIEFENLQKAGEYYQVTINKEALVENSLMANNPEWEQKGLFASRIPGTYGETEETIVLPLENVFTTDDGRTYIAFLPKEKKPLVVGKDGMPVSMLKRKTGEELYRKHYDKVERAFRSKEQLQEPAKVAGQFLEKIPATPLKAK